MKPRDLARRKARLLQREGMPYRVARVVAGRLVAGQEVRVPPDGR